MTETNIAKNVQKAIRECIDDIWFKFHDTYRVNGYTYDVWETEMVQDILPCYVKEWKDAIDEFDKAERKMAETPCDIDYETGCFCEEYDYWFQKQGDAQDIISYYEVEARNQLEDLFDGLDETLHDILVAG